MAVGLFVGLITLDFIYLTPALPQPNQKQVAQDYTIAAGGPATNAAVAFQFLSSSANSSLSSSTRLMGVMGNHPISRFIWADLQAQQIDLLDLQPDWPEPVPVSSVLVTQTTAERAVISINATRLQVEPSQIPDQAIADVDVVLIDGHQMAVGAVIAQRARQAGIPVVVDAGSWKPGFETVLRSADYVICSANFQPPNRPADLLAYLQDLGIPCAAVTHGQHPIQIYQRGKRLTLPVPQISAVDTVGAGDVLHGAFCHFIRQSSFLEALQQAAEVAALSCQSFGTRQWMGAALP